VPRTAELKVKGSGLAMTFPAASVSMLEIELLQAGLFGKKTIS
jgi:hypothetical protein